MKNKHIQLMAVLAALCLSAGAWGQASEADELRGELHLETPLLLSSTVILSSEQSHQSFRADVTGDGTFEFRHVPYGQYNLTVLDSSASPIHQEIVSVQGQNQPIMVQVSRQASVRPPAGAVSASQLLHPPSKKAFSAFLAARKFADSGAYEKAATQLEKAVSLSPGYADAWINLAAQHIRLHRYEQALQELRHASDIERPTAVILGNMAFAQFALHRHEEATGTARQALQLDSSYAPAHYLLGSFLTSDRRTVQEGLRHLEIAARTMPSAQANLERVKRDLAQVVTHP